MERVETLHLSPPNEKQKLFLQCRKKYIAFGGARGGGKSWAVRTKAKLMALRYPGIRMLLVRRTYQELENNQVLKAVVDISGKKMGNAVFTQTLKVINKQADGEKVIQVPIDLYTKTEDGKQWLATHVDGLP